MHLSLFGWNNITHVYKHTYAYCSTHIHTYPCCHRTHSCTWICVCTHTHIATHKQVHTFTNTPDTHMHTLTHALARFTVVHPPWHTLTHTHTYACSRRVHSCTSAYWFRYSRDTQTSGSTSRRNAFRARPPEVRRSGLLPVQCTPSKQTMY